MEKKEKRVGAIDFIFYYGFQIFRVYGKMGIERKKRCVLDSVYCPQIIEITGRGWVVGSYLFQHYYDIRSEEKY